MFIEMKLLAGRVVVPVRINRLFPSTFLSVMGSVVMGGDRYTGKTDGRKKTMKIPARMSADMIPAAVRYFFFIAFRPDAF
jgi:hypothetical protein